MESASFRKWRSERDARLYHIEHAHRAVSGSKRGRRWTTESLNHAYAVLLTSEFQGYCRDLHSEAVDHLVSAATPASLRGILRLEFTRDRKLDKGNPSPGNVRADFNRLGVSFWDSVLHEDKRNKRRQEMLENLSGWRNAIAHQDFSSRKLTPRKVHFATVQGWRRALNALTWSFDRVMRKHLASVLGSAPW